MKVDIKKSRFSTNVSLYLGNDRAIVTMERQYELVFGLSNGAISSDLE